MNKRQARHLADLLEELKEAFLAHGPSIATDAGLDLRKCIWRHHYDQAPESQTVQFVCEECLRRGRSVVVAKLAQTIVVMRNEKFDLPIPSIFRAELYFGACRGCRARWCLVVYRWRKAGEAAPPPPPISVPTRRRRMRLASGMRDSFLAAMRASAIPDGERGPWRVTRFEVNQDVQLGIEMQGRPVPSAGQYVSLLNAGICVMNDTDPELLTHFDFILRARGAVLVMGLGLGCVVRGLLAKKKVASIDVVERDDAVLDLVAPFMPRDARVRVHHAEAEEFVARTRKLRWDCAWHDLWTDRDKGEPHLQVLHNRLLIALKDRVRMQGAWQYPRDMRRMLRQGLEMEVI